MIFFLMLDPLAARYPDFEGKIYEVELSKGDNGIGMLSIFVSFEFFNDVSILVEGYCCWHCSSNFTMSIKLHISRALIASAKLSW